MSKIYPVVHVQSPEQAVEQSSLAFELGADGVYLIDHYGGTPYDMADTFNAVDEANPEKFIGINFLNLPGTLTPMKFLQMANEKGWMNRLPNGLWVDDAFDHIPYRKPLKYTFKGVGSLALDDEVDPEDFRYAVSELVDTQEFREDHPELNEVKLLGGVAFKYTRSFTEDPTAAKALAEIAAPYMDVICSSGSGTGRAATVDKIRAMKQAAKDAGKPLAVASGVDASNIGLYGRAIDEVLVASSVETKSYSGEFDPVKLDELIRLAHKGQWLKGVVSKFKG